MKTIWACLIVIAVAMGCTHSPALTKASSQPEPIVLRTGDWPIGELGHPVGELLLIEGTRLKGPMTGIRTLQIDTINGRRLPAPIAIWIENVDLPGGTRCALRGYETIRMVGQAPAYDEFAKLKNLPPPGAPQAGWQVSNYFVAIEVVQPASVKLDETDTSYPTTSPVIGLRSDSYDAALVAAICDVADGTDCIQDGGLNHLKAILDKHPNLVNARRVYTSPHKPSARDYWPPLNLAAWNGNEQVAKILLDRGADVNSTEDFGCTPLHRAAMMGHLSIVKMLVENGADVNAKTIAQPEMSSDALPSSPPPGTEPATTLPAVPAQTALDLARQWKHDDVVEYLQSLSQ